MIQYLSHSNTEKLEKNLSEFGFDIQTTYLSIIVSMITCCPEAQVYQKNNKHVKKLK